MALSKAIWVNFISSKKGTILICSFLLIISIIFLVQTYAKAYRENGYDFTTYLLASKALLKGTNPYQTGSIFPYIYPLFLCVVLLPLSLIPYWLSTLFWFIGSLGALYYAAVLLLRQYSHNPSQRDTLAHFAVSFLLVVNVIQNNLLNGQVNFIVLLLCTLFFVNYINSHKFTASLFLSAAIAIKLTPIVLLVYLIFRKDVFMFSAVFLVSIILSFLVPFIIGGEATFSYYTAYLHSFLKTNLTSSGQTTEGVAFSISSIIGFLIPSIPKQLTIITAGILALSPIVMLQHISRGDRSSEKESIIFSLYMMAILLINPVSETHHLINLFPALLVMIVSMIQCSERRFNIGALVLATVFVSLIAGKFIFEVYIVTIIILYSVLIFLFHSQRGGRTTAHDTAKK